MNNQKGLSPLLIVVLIAGAISGYFLYSKNIAQNQKKPIPELSTQTSIAPQDKKNIGTIEEDEKTGEQIYKNSTLNYSIRVPKGWTIKDNLGVFISIPGEAVLYSPGQDPNLPFGTGIAVFAAKDKVGLRLPYRGDFKQALSEKSSSGEEEHVFKLGNSKVAGLDAVQFVNRTLPGDATETFYAVITWVVYKDMNYYFEFFGDEKLIKQNLHVYNNILSTFSFLNQNQIDTSYWKIYANTKYGYSIKYPDSWIVNESDSSGVNSVGMGRGSKGGFVNGGQSVLIQVTKEDSPNEDKMGAYIKDKIAPNSNPKRLGYVNINNYSGPKWSFNNNDEDDNYAIFFNIADNQYLLIKELSNKSLFKEYNSEIEQVISTFKLTR